MSKTWTLLILTFYLVVWNVRNEIFTSTFQLCKLLQNEVRVLKSLLQHSENAGDKDTLVEKLSRVKEYLPPFCFDNDFENPIDCIVDDSKAGKFVSHPVNAYFLVRRFTYEWKDILALVESIGDAKMTKIAHRLYFPGPTELQGVRSALVRMGVYYDLDPMTIANGTLFSGWESRMSSWTSVPKKLTFEDMFEIGKVAYNMDDREQTSAWMGAAYSLIKDEDPKDVDSGLAFDVMDYLSWAEFTVGNFKDALELCRKMLVINPTHERTLNNVKAYSNRPDEKISEASWQRKSRANYMEYVKSNRSNLDAFKAALNYFKLNGSKHYDIERAVMEILCKSSPAWEIDEHNLKGCRCHVKAGDKRWGKFTKVRVEKIYNDPDVHIIRNVVSDEEIMHLKKLATSTLKDALVHNSATGNLETAYYRVTQSSWHSPNSDPIISRIRNRLRIATGLNMDNSEDLQMANYGVGGYYDLHFDFAMRNEASYNDLITTTRGPRLATFLIYMSNVEAGGNTGFSRLGISAKPSKGDALFWYNLHRDLTGDARTRHSACPTAIGTKWVGNFWVRARGEENSRPCLLHEQDGL